MSVESREPSRPLAPLPCPFCGSDKITQEFANHLCWCFCEGCATADPDAELASDLDPADAMLPAILAWNRRANAPDPSLFSPFDHPTPDFPLPPIPPEQDTEEGP